MIEGKPAFSISPFKTSLMGKKAAVEASPKPMPPGLSAMLIFLPSSGHNIGRYDELVLFCS